MPRALTRFCSIVCALENQQSREFRKLQSINTHDIKEKHHNQQLSISRFLSLGLATMAKVSIFSVLVVAMCLVFASGVTCQQLSPLFYLRTCPQALRVIRTQVFSAVAKEPRMGASLLRLHFHDCFVNVLLRPPDTLARLIP